MPRRSRKYKIGLHERLQDDDEMLMYLQAAMEDSSSAFLKALRNVAEARNLSKLAESSNLDRVNLYRMLSETGNPRISSLVSLLESLRLRLSVESAISVSENKETDVLTSKKVKFVFPVQKKGYVRSSVETPERVSTSSRSTSNRHYGGDCFAQPAFA